MFNINAPPPNKSIRHFLIFPIQIFDKLGVLGRVLSPFILHFFGRIGNKIDCYYIRNTNAELTIGTSSELFLNESIVTDLTLFID